MIKDVIYIQDFQEEKIDMYQLVSKSDFDTGQYHWNTVYVTCNFSLENLER